VCHPWFTLAQAEFIEKTANVIAIVMYAELALDYGGHAPGRPMIVRKTIGHRAIMVNLRHTLELLVREAAGPASGFPAFEGIDSLICQRAIPPRSRGAADGKFASDL